MGLEFSKNKKFFFGVAGVAIAIPILSFLFIISPPHSFPKESTITVSEGTGLHSLSLKLDGAKVIRSPFWFRAFAIVLGGERDMKAGDYYMPHPQNSFIIAWRIFRGFHDIETVKITIPEGFTVKKISNLFDQRFAFFDHSAFESSALEGYLFPDTYFVPVTISASSTIKLFSDNFERRISPLMPKINSSGRTLEEIIIVASILEGEAKDRENMKIVSDILWKRLDLGLPLQVDASFVYIIGKSTKELTKDDLKIDSPYNTYLYRGLPPTPISNPGLEAIESALAPSESPYLYFLTSDDGEMHYSRTFDEHVEKKLKYISR